MRGRSSSSPHRVGKPRVEARTIVRILQFIKEDPTREGLIETPRRVVKAFKEMTVGYDTDISKILGVTFDVDCDEMVVIDTDLVFKPQDLAHLLEHDEPLVFGLYSKRTVKFEAPIVPLPGMENPSLCEGIRWEVAKTARGFMRVHRSVFEKMKPHVTLMKNTEFGDMHRFWPTSYDGTSEDFAFCAKWRKMGNEVFVAPWVKITHVGHHVFSGNMMHSLMLQQEIRQAAEASQAAPGSPETA
jgi:hypothetical protein